MSEIKYKVLFGEVNVTIIVKATNRMEAIHKAKKIWRTEYTDAIVTDVEAEEESLKV